MFASLSVCNICSFIFAVYELSHDKGMVKEVQRHEILGVHWVVQLRGVTTYLRCAARAS